MSESILLTNRQMAAFAAQGFLRFDAVVPRELCDTVLGQIETDALPNSWANPNKREEFGAPFYSLWEGEPLGEAIRLPEVRGAVESLVGPDPAFDHHFTHIVPANHHEGQMWHADATIDVRLQAFDAQLFFFWQDTPREMGGTMVLPGSHLRRVDGAEIACYQNLAGQLPIVCEAGTLLVCHQAIWHCAQPNLTDRTRYMTKIRVNPTVPQRRLWIVDDEPVGDLLMGSHGLDGGLQHINAIRFWRYLIADDGFDVDYHVTRIEMDPERRARVPAHA